MSKFQSRYIKIACICLLAAGSVKAQQFKWAVSGGTWVDDFVNKMVIDKMGNVYTTGQIGSFGSGFGVTFNGWGFFLMKQNSAGAITWIRYSSGTAYNAIGQDIAVDSKGNVYVAGAFNYDMVLTDTTLVSGASGPDAMIFFIKYDSSGNRKWARVLGNDGEAGEPRLAVDDHDNIYLAGDYIFNINFGNGIKLTGDHPYYWPFNDAFLSRFSPEGNAIWALSFSTFSDDGVMAISTGPGQKVNLLGLYESTDLIAGGVSYPLENKDASYIASVDKDGNILKVLPTASANDLVVNENGDFYISGLYETTGGFVSKIRADYVTEWIKPIETNANAKPHITLSGKDVYVGSAYFQSASIDSLSVTSYHGLFTAKISDIGVAQWLRNYPSVYNDQVYTMAGRDNGMVGMAGYYTEGHFVLDGHSMTNNSGNNDGDIFIALMQDTTVSKCPRKNSLLFATSQQICNGDSTLLSTNTGSGYYLLDWFVGDHLVASGSGYYAKEEGNYSYIRYPGTVCADTSNVVHIMIVPIPGIASPPSGPLNLCESAINIVYNETPLENTIQYSWVIQDGTAVSTTILTNMNSLSLNSMNAGLNTITVAGINQCQQTGISSQITVEVDPRLKVPSLNKANCDGQLSTDGNIHIQWYKDGRVLTDTLNILQVLDSGYYKVSVKNFCGVVSSDSVAVYPVMKSDLIIPNVVTPNGDGKNDYFKIDKSFLGSALVIVDRWGGMIFKTESYSNDWTGAGQDSGVYFYCLQSPCLSVPFKGWVQVVK